MVVGRSFLLSTILLAGTSISYCSGFTSASSSSSSYIRLDVDIQAPLSLPSVVDDAISSSSKLSPVLQEIANERLNFQMNLGKAMDTLRKDLPYILKETPDYSIYHEDIAVVDPSGVQSTGIDTYKSSIKFMQQFINFWFQQDKQHTTASGLQYRLVYDFARSSIKVSWHVTLIPKMPLGKPLHIDGISMYKLDSDFGKINEHRFESMSINNTPIVPPYGVFFIVAARMGINWNTWCGCPRWDVLINIIMIIPKFEHS